MKPNNGNQATAATTEAPRPHAILGLPCDAQQQQLHEGKESGEGKGVPGHNFIRVALASNKLNQSLHSIRYL